MDVLPKIGDIKNLKDLSTVIVLPMICACYLYQSDFTIEFDNWILSVNNNASLFVQILQTVLIFIAKTLFAGLIGALLYVAILFSDIYMNNTFIPVIVLVLLTFGFVGIFAPNKIYLMSNLKSLWFYSSFVISFFLLAHYDQITENT